MSATQETTQAPRKPSGKMEKRAAVECERIAANGYGAFSVRWVKSATWGHCPRIDNFHGDKCAHASGCGYDKLSAVVCEYLNWLAPWGLSSSGAGISAVTTELAKHGWTLEHTYNGANEDGFKIERKADASA